MLLGDQPALTADVGFYQRLLVRDRQEAVVFVKELRPLFGHFDETSYWNTGNGLVEIDRLDGDPELASTQTVIWVKPEDGYTVNGVQLDLSR